jgi:PHD/YefM family antitoxin component YafN of YafNO toxin-antitoxin module
VHNIEKDVTSMIKVSAAEFQRNIDRYQDMALEQPVAITRNGRERTVMLSVEEYHRLKRRDRQALGLEDSRTRTLQRWRRRARRSPRRRSTASLNRRRVAFPEPVPSRLVSRYG